MKGKRFWSVITIMTGLVFTVSGFFGVERFYPRDMIAMWVGILLVEQGRRDWKERP